MDLSSTTRFTVREWKRVLFPGPGYSGVRPDYSAKRVYSWMVLERGQVLTVSDSVGQPWGYTRLIMTVLTRIFTTSGSSKGVF